MKHLKELQWWSVMTTGLTRDNLTRWMERKIFRTLSTLWNYLDPVHWILSWTAPYLFNAKRRPIIYIPMNIKRRLGLTLIKSTPFHITIPFQSSNPQSWIDTSFEFVTPLGRPDGLQRIRWWCGTIVKNSQTLMRIGKETKASTLTTTRYNVLSATNKVDSLFESPGEKRERSCRVWSDFMLIEVVVECRP